MIENTIERVITSNINLYDACKNNQIEQVEKYLKLNDNIKIINRVDRNGSRALHVASYYGHNEIVQLLLTNGAF